MSTITTMNECPACGWPDLPTIAAETLHARCGHNAVALYPLPDGEIPVMGGGRWYRMPQAAWTAYRQLCAQRGPFSFFAKA